MSVSADTPRRRVRPDPGAAVEALKPVTWFPPVWAFLCGAVSSGAAFEGRWGALALGLALAGPLVCGASQALNDWCDREVDAINAPGRPVPSGRLPGRWGLWLAGAAAALALAVGWALGPVAFAATLLGLVAAWAYSAEPLRLKRDGRVSALVCGLSYETLPWITGAAVLAGAMPDARVFAVAILYGLGAHGIMTLNDFKAMEGDRRFGLASLPVRLGPARAARLALWTMLGPQVAVIALLFVWGQGLHAVIVAGLVMGQTFLTPRLLADPARHAVWFAGFGVLLYVLGMLTAACALRLEAMA